MADQQPKRNAETIRGQVVTYLGHLDGAEVSLSELASAVGVWHLQLSQVLRPLIRRGAVRVRSVDGRPRYRIGSEVPDVAAHGTDAVARLFLLEQRVADLEARLATIQAATLCASIGHARDNQDRCHRCGVVCGVCFDPPDPATD